MTKDEIKGLMNFLNAAYPSKVRAMTDDERKAQLIVWYTMFADDSAEMVGRAVKEHIATSSFYPTISEIRRSIRKYTMADPKDLFHRFQEIGYKAIHPEVIEEGHGREAKYYTKHYTDTDLSKEPRELREYCENVRKLRLLYDEYRNEPSRFMSKFISDIEKIQETMDIRKIGEVSGNERYLP